MKFCDRRTSRLAILALLAVFNEILLRFARKMADGAVDILAVLIGSLGSADKQSRRSLDSSAFPGRAWERGCRRSSAAVSFVSAASLTPGPAAGRHRYLHIAGCRVGRAVRGPPASGVVGLTSFDPPCILRGEMRCVYRRTGGKERLKRNLCNHAQPSS